MYKNRIKKIPSLLEFMGYIFCLGSILVGPVFSFKTYLAFSEHKDVSSHTSCIEEFNTCSREICLFSRFGIPETLERSQTQQSLPWKVHCRLWQLLQCTKQWTPTFQGALLLIQLFSSYPLSKGMYHHHPFIYVVFSFFNGSESSDMPTYFVLPYCLKPFNLPLDVVSLQSRRWYVCLPRPFLVHFLIILHLLFPGGSVLLWLDWPSGGCTTSFGAFLSVQWFCQGLDSVGTLKLRSLTGE